MSFNVKRTRLSSSLRHKPSLLLLAKERNKLQSDTFNWSQLPLELIVLICSYLQPRDKRNVFLVCAHWSAAANVPLLWRNTWVTLKSNLLSRPHQFWDLVRSRLLAKVHLHGYTSSDSHVSSDLILLSNNIPYLKGLHIDYGRKVEDKGFKHILKFENLTELKLDFRRCLYTSVAMETDLSLKQLRVLERLSLVGVVSMGLNHPTLSSLSLDTCGSFKASDTNTILSHFPLLKKLVINKCIYYYSFISKHKEDVTMCHMPLLTHVNLANTSFDGSKCLCLPGWFCKITSLNLSYCKQNQEQLIVLLSQLHHLLDLNLTGNFCTDETLRRLTCHSLQSLNLSFNHDLTTNGIQHLSNLVRDTLMNLSLSHCSGLVSRREQVLTNLSVLFPNIQVLDLCGWSLSSHKIRELLLKSKVSLVY